MRQPLVENAIRHGISKLPTAGTIEPMAWRAGPNLRGFVRVHRSAAVNTTRIRELRVRSHGDFTVVLQDNTEVAMSRGYRAELESWLRQPI